MTRDEAIKSIEALIDMYKQAESEEQWIDYVDLNALYKALEALTVVKILMDGGTMISGSRGAGKINSILYEVRRYIGKTEEALEALEPKEISYQDCSNALLKMWMDNVLTDGEYYRIIDRLLNHAEEIK